MAMEKRGVDDKEVRKIEDLADSLVRSAEKKYAGSKIHSSIAWTDDTATISIYVNGEVKVIRKSARC